MVGRKVYLQPKRMLLDVILDIIELQKGKVVFSDMPQGIVHYYVSMYGFKWMLLYTVTDVGENRCRVQLEVGGELTETKRQIVREFALIDYMLVSGTEIEINETEG